MPKINAKLLTKERKKKNTFQNYVLLELRIHKRNSKEMALIK